MSDLIRRKDVLEAMSKDQWYFIKPREQIERINAIPTAEPKVGKWIDVGWDGEKCSLCGYSIDDTFYSAQFNYCPNCGAKMKRSNR